MNEAPASTGDLISRHFDEELPPADHQILTAALNADPASRLDFAATARLHASLEVLAPALPLVRKRRSAKWLTAGAAAAALVTGGAFIMMNPAQKDYTRITMEDMRDRPDGKPIKLKPRDLMKRVVKTPAAGTIESVELQDLLSRYYVDVSPHGLTVPQALIQLEEAIKSVNMMGRKELDGLSFSAAAPRDPSLPDPVVYAKRRTPMPVLEYIWVCGHYRDVVQNPGSLTWKPDMNTSELSAMAGPPAIREFRVPPDFLSTGGETPPYPEGNATAAKLARSLGVRLAQDESATFSPGPATITVSARPATLHKLEQRLGLLFDIVPKQIFVNTLYIKLPRTLLPADFNEETGLILNKEKFGHFSGLVLKESQAAIVGSPDVTLKASQQGKIQVVKEVGSELPNNGYVGLTQTILPVLSGELIRVEGLVELGVLDGLDMPGGFQALGLSNQGSPLPQYFRTEYELWLPAQSTGLFLLDSPQGDEFVTLACLTASLIDPAGLPLK